MSKLLSWNEINTKTFKEASELIINCIPPNTWNEYEAEGVRGHRGVIQFYREQASKASYHLNSRGLYFFITKQKEVYYVGRKNYNIMNRLYAYSWREDFKECYTAIVDFPQHISFQHLKFYEAMFIVILQPAGNRKDGKGNWVKERFAFMKDKNITLEDAYRIRTYHKPEN